MSCTFISTLRQLSNLSCDAVANIESFSNLKKYLHVVRAPESALRDVLSRIDNASRKQLVLVCGSAGDGKSHLLSHLKNETNILDDYSVINDATESDAPNKTAIATLAKRIEAFNDENIEDGGKEKIVLAINLGMLNNFIDSDEGKKFSKLQGYVTNNNIFSVDKSLPFDPNSFFHHVDFSDYQLYTLTENGVKSDYLTKLFRKIFAKTEDNPFYHAYCASGNCDARTFCPVRHNFEFLTNETVQDILIQKIIEVCIKNKLVVTSRDVLNFVFDAIVPHDFDKNELWRNNSKSFSKFIPQYISYTTPMLVFDNQGTSPLIDHLTALKNESDNVECRDEELIGFYSNDDVSLAISQKISGSCYEATLTQSQFPALDNEKELKKYLFKFLLHFREMTDPNEDKDEMYLMFVKDLYRVYSGRNKELISLYDAVAKSIFSWDGFFGNSQICIDDSNEKYSILEELKIKPHLVKQESEQEIQRFLPSITVNFTGDKDERGSSIHLDYALYKMIQTMKDGYRPSSQDCNIHADFVSNIKALIELGDKRERVFIQSKNADQKQQFVFEENAFGGYSFKEVVV